MELGLKGRRVLITGGSQGIGYGVAEGFLEEGCSVVIASKNEERLRSAVESLSKYGRDKVRGKAIDLSLPGAAAALADSYNDTDILINNAGAIPSGDIFEIDEARWREAWDLKVFGYINLMRAMFAHMRGHPPKVILNVIGMIPETIRRAFKASWTPPYGPSYISWHSDYNDERVRTEIIDQRLVDPRKIGRAHV